MPWDEATIVRILMLKLGDEYVYLSLNFNQRFTRIFINAAAQLTIHTRNRLFNNHQCAHFPCVVVDHHCGLLVFVTISILHGI